MKRKLLIADDEDMSRKIIRRFFEKEFDIYEAKDGQEALDIIEDNEIDAMILDIIMPGMDGLSVLHRIKEDDRYRYMGILVATSTKEKTERESLILGADDVVSKPYDPTVIKKRLNNILNLKQYQRTAEYTYKDKIDPILSARMDDIANDIVKSTKVLAEATKVIKDNKDNHNLITLMLEKIEEESNNIKHIINHRGK